MIKSSAEMVAAAEAAIDNLTPAEAGALNGQDGITFVDLRDPRELKREGKIAGAVHAPRGMLEFWIDPQSPYFKPVFGSGDRFVFYCAAGWRSALATKLAKDMGLTAVAHIKGGFAAWRDAGLPIDPPEPR